MYQAIAANYRRTVFLFFVFMGLVIGLGYVLAIVFDASSFLWLAVAISLFSVWGSYFYSDKIALLVSGAQPIKKRDFPQLVRVVENLSIAAGIPTPAIYVISDPSPNAFATGRGPRHAALAVTTGLLKILDKTELEGVMAHELSHIKNFDILVATVAVTLAGTVALASEWFLRFNFLRGSRDNKEGTNLLVLVGLILVILAPLFATLIQLAISRRREFLADASGAFLTRYPQGLIRALEKLTASPHLLRRVSGATAHLFIVNPLKKQQGIWSTLWSTHPPLEARIAALRDMEGKI